METITRHAASRETPLPIYIGLMLHSATRNKKSELMFMKRATASV